MILDIIKYYNGHIAFVSVANHLELGMRASAFGHSISIVSLYLNPVYIYSFLISSFPFTSVLFTKVA